MEISGHKRMLHEKVLIRQAGLQEALTRLEAHPRMASSDRARAIGEALTVLDVHLSTAWEKIGSMQSVALVDWLDATQFLPDAKGV